ncbi:MAG TPA: glutamate formimidoyltransferase [Bryobacteraceae bacterium]|nr:glutamate formimidoyltransferase [Bryobacteraceae bacterium]
MTRPMVECVPNFSEGRDSARIEAIAERVRAVPSVFLLDRHSDADHNRSVLTFAGQAAAVAEAAFQAVEQAAALIDLTRHRGQHPRIGAADVVPFIPLDGATLADCAALARGLGERIWERLRIPAYLYGAAAAHPGRERLENVRRGQFEGLRVEAGLSPDRAPDIGGAFHPTAGAVAVGARKFLIACNVNLASADWNAARSIARTVRFSSGGLPEVKAMGVMLPSRNLAQVSMNLTDFEVTPVHVAVEAVRREAEKLGVGIAGTEIVGLIPRKAFEASEECLRREGFGPGIVLETRLAQAAGLG